MAATKGLNPVQQKKVRDQIKTTQLVKRLQHFGLNESDDGGQSVDIDPNRLRAIEILLRKSLPDLSNVQHSGDADNPILGHVTWNFGDGNQKP